MKKKLTNNLLLKIISVIAAFLLWMVVINIDNPTDTFTISNIPITVQNENALTDSNLTYEVVGDATASVEVTARRTDRRRISADDFAATIDLGEIYAATGSVAVNISVVDNGSLIRSWTQITRSVEVHVEEMQTREFDIEVIQAGELENSYTVSGIAVSPEKVRVTAPESIMDQIDHAAVQVSVDGATDNISASGEVKFYRANGEELEITDERVQVSTETAEVSLTVVQTNQIPIVVQVTGQDEVAQGYKYITYQCETQTVAVTGAKSLIANFDNITLEADLTGASGNITRTYRISDYLPEGLELAEGQPETVEVVFQVEQLATRSFRIDRDQINMTGTDSNLSYQLGTDNTVTVVLEGLSEDLEQVTNNDISVTIDVSAIDGAGVYQIEPEVTVSEAYESYFELSADTVQVTVTSSDSGTEPSGSVQASESESESSSTGTETGGEPQSTERE